MTAFIPFFQLSERSIVCYDQFQLQRKKNILSANSMNNLTRGKYTGQMSENTRKDLRKKLSVYYDCMYNAGQKWREKKKVFHPIVTLTLPSSQMHDDNTIKRECLMRFVESIKYNFDVKFYYWVAEKQANANIHFHLLIDRFIPHDVIRSKWNERLEKLEYISAFETKHGHRNPNSIDIQAIRNLSKSSDYVTKYTSKVNQQGGIQGRLHGECDQLKLCKKYASELWSEMYAKLNELVESKTLKVKQLEKCWIYEGDIRQMMKKEMPRTLQRWNDYYASIRTSFYD